MPQDETPLEGQAEPEPSPSASGNPQQRLTAHAILDVVVQSGRDELHRSLSGLGFSALAGGITIGISALALALLRDVYGNGPASTLLQAAAYPIGFIAVIIGRAQFFTENTLFPVVTYMDDRAHVRRLLAFWGVVLGANLIGTLLFALLTMKTGALPPAVQSELAGLGVEATAGSFGAIFWSAVIAGWLMALVAWTVSASRWTSGQILITWFLTLLIGLGHFSHCVASSAEGLAAVVAGETGLIHYLAWLVPAVLGNLAGGIVIVSWLNYGQVHAGMGREE